MMVTIALLERFITKSMTKILISNEIPFNFANDTTVPKETIALKAMLEQFVLKEGGN
jgi:hypothetical protein